MILTTLRKAAGGVRLPISVKLSALVAGAVIVTAFAVNEVYVRGANQILIDRSIRELEQEAKYFQYPLEGIINQIRDDVQLLAGMQATQGLARAGAEGLADPVTGASRAELEDRLTTTFSEMLRTREHYLQVRVIGVADEGRTVLRVQRFGNQVERAPASQLQRRGQEAWFQSSLRLSPGQVYLSEPNLNRDNGVVTQPHALVLRAAATLYDAENATFGVVVINVDFAAVLRDVRSGLAASRSLAIANASGDYLLHSDPTALYATDLAHDRHMQDDDVRLLEVMRSPERDTFAFIPEDVRNGNVLAVHKFHFDALQPEDMLIIAVEAPYRDIVAATADVSRRGFLFSAGVAMAALVASVFLLRLLIRPLNSVADAVVRYRKGEKAIALPTESPDEIGVLAREFAVMMTQKGEEDWVKEKLVAVSRNLLGFKDLRSFADALLAALAPAVGAQVGVVYVSGAFARQHGVHETETLNFLSAWGYRSADGESLPRSFKWGEGLVGSCARMRTRMLVSDVPPNYLRITSAVGESAPKQILLLPVLFENTLVAVIELATFGAFSEVQLALLDEASFNVGVIMNSINAGMRTQELLEEARQTAEELQRSEEELKTQQEELEASNEEMEEKTKALEEQNARIREQAAELEETKRLIEEKAAELELSNRYKSEFLANMSHELRTPLNSLLILARSLAANEDGNLTDEQIEEARVIHNGGLELLSLINDILDLSKVEAGKITIAPEDVPIADIAKRMSQQFDPVAKERGLPFHVRLDDGLPESLHTDGQRVEQILKNLLSNAFKFTSAGSVTLQIGSEGRAGPQRSSGASEAIVFSVIDTGVGIEASKLRDIFEAFQQENGSIDRHYGGTGLGLTIARKFAHLLNGEIHVDSVKGQGSTFALRLPITNGAAVKASAAGSPGRAVAAPATGAGLSAAERDDATELKAMPKTSLQAFIPDDRKSIGPDDKVVLVIEDDADFAATLLKIARRHGYKAIVAGDGKSGLLLAAELPVTAILLDLRLPDIDGLGVLDQLKHDLRTRHIPVHIISGREKHDAVAPLRKGALGYLTKPVSAEAIGGVFTRIEDLLRLEVKRVLVVEDDRNTQTAIQALLRQKNVEIVVADSGGAAFDMLRTMRFDCVILDLKLPDMTGFEWLEAAEREIGEAAPPVVVYTAKELTEEENRRLNRHTGSIVIKGASSSDRLLDEVTLFLHSMESALSNDQRAMIRMQHDPDRVLQGRTALLVDDDLRNTFALSKLLKKRGMTVVIADNGKMAIEKLEEESAIDLVVMDIMMPVMDGYQAMREIRTRENWRSLPIIALTARAMPEEQERCMAAGANDYLVKPVDVDRFLTLMRVWLFRQEKAA
jgi:CheY-like chemotaxis protein/HAMP domain-containing protein